MSTILLVGHAGFYNRGCEAILQTTVDLLRDRLGPSRIVLSSFSHRDDRMHCPVKGLEVVPARAERWSPAWVCYQIGRRVGAQGYWRYPLAPVWRAVRQADLVLSIGGDNYSTDYGTLDYFLWLNRLVKEEQRPLVVWAASVGPFGDPDVERKVIRNLREVDVITVRESVTWAYLTGHGLSQNLRRVADPAFLLPSRPVDTSGFWPVGDGVLGLNVSPLLSRYQEERVVLDAAVQATRYAVDELGMGVLLIPHVTGPRTGADDQTALRPVLELADRGDRVRLMPTHHDAMEAKHIISRCRLFIGARTHSTISAFSSGVPTICLAYSAKGIGISKDVLGETRYVVDVRTMKEEELTGALRDLAAQECTVRAYLARQVPHLKDLARAGVDCAADLLGEARTAREAR